MKTYLASYANKVFFKSQQILKRTALKYGIDQVIDYDEIWLKKQTNFYKKNKHILSQKRGNGYWLWKPLIILETLKKMDDGDILFYVDAGCEIVSNVTPLVKLTLEKNVLLFYCNGHKNNVWSKRDCFYYMNCDEEKYHFGNQVVATYLVIKNIQATKDLITEWLAYATNEKVITDNFNTCGLPNLPKFQDHRHDQSIISNLAIKYNIELYRDPSQWGNWLKMPELRIKGEFTFKDYSTKPFENSIYPTIFSSNRIKHPLSLSDEIHFLFRSISNNFCNKKSI